MDSEWQESFWKLPISLKSTKAKDIWCFTQIWKLFTNFERVPASGVSSSNEPRKHGCWWLRCSPAVLFVIWHALGEYQMSHAAFWFVHRSSDDDEGSTQAYLGCTWRRKSALLVKNLPFLGEHSEDQKQFEHWEGSGETRLLEKTKPLKPFPVGMLVFHAIDGNTTCWKFSWQLRKSTSNLTTTFVNA